MLKYNHKQDMRKKILKPIIIILAIAVSAAFFALPSVYLYKRAIPAEEYNTVYLTGAQTRDYVNHSLSGNIPIHLKNAVIAVEDRRFYEHNGFDYIRIVRAFFTNIREGRIVEGGSTISQQYVKNAYLYPDRTLSRKIKEAYLTIQLERNYPKEKILLMYLDTIYLGSGTFGVEEASRLYFGTEPHKLNLSQSALLAGIIRAPEIYSPINNLELSVSRRNTVLSLMYEQGYIDKQQYIDAILSPVELNT